MNHATYSKLLTERVPVALVGAGGSGSQMLTGLARLHCGLLSLNHPGLHVIVYDPDAVTGANVGRQLFSPADVGQPKANVLIHRLNCFFGLDWVAQPTVFPGHAQSHALIISCVDTKAARREIGAKSFRPHAQYWLDLGNDQYTGQVILGGHGLPTVLGRHPEIKRSKKEDNTPSCSLAEAIGKQSLFVNQAVSTWALHLLETMFRKGGIDHCGYYINLTSGRVSPIVAPVDPPKKPKAKTLMETLQ